MTAAVIPALAAGAARANAVMKTPMAHVGFHWGPLNLETNVTPWGIVAAAIFANIALSLGKDTTKQLKLQTNYYQAKAYGLWYAGLLDSQAADAQRVVETTMAINLEKDPRKKVALMGQLEGLRQTMVSTHDRIKAMERALEVKFPDLYFLCRALGGMGQKQWQGGSARKHILQFMAEKMKRPEYEYPSPMKALGTTMGSFATDVTKGIRSGWG